jgi:hypothetical protein
MLYSELITQSGLRADERFYETDALLIDNSFLHKCGQSINYYTNTLDRGDTYLSSNVAFENGIYGIMY